MKQFLGKIIFSSRWLLYPVNIGLLVVLTLYVGTFLYHDYHFIRYEFKPNLEALMILMLGFVDASMVANLILMIVQGSHQIFIQKFSELSNKTSTPQYLDHIDSGILKIKIALAVAGITLVQLLKDFVDIEKVDWSLTEHRIILHVVTLLSALMMAIIWRVTHPNHNHKEDDNHAKK